MANSTNPPTIVVYTEYEVTHGCHPTVTRMQFSASALEYKDSIAEQLHCTVTPDKKHEAFFKLEKPPALAQTISLLSGLGFNLQGNVLDQGNFHSFLILIQK
jgi:hypothetical protein